jgi:endogenous inhibitor of DNA gyrase (YacG/DUF329 family)
MPETQPCPICSQRVAVVDSIEEAPAVTGSQAPASATTLHTKCPRCETPLERAVAPGASLRVNS